MRPNAYAKSLIPPTAAIAIHLPTALHAVRDSPWFARCPTTARTLLCATFRFATQCRREYLDPSNRRFRAEPIACPKCGPNAWLEVTAPRWKSQVAGEDCVARAAAILRAGGIVAIQGIGGVHLACDATSEAAVARLRTIKRRIHKPFAVMVDSIESARSLAYVSEDEAALLMSPQAPIVLLRRARRMLNSHVLSRRAMTMSE